MTKNDMCTRIYFWSMGYQELSKKFYNMTTDGGRKEYEEFCQSVGEARVEILRIIKGKI